MIIFADPIFGHAGYAHAVRNLALALSKHTNVNVLPQGSGYLPEKFYKLLGNKGATNKDYLVVRPYFDDPFKYNFPGRIIGNVVLESTLPEKMVKQCNDDRIWQIWVPSTFVKDNAIKSGVIERKIKVVPHGHDPDIFKVSRKKDSFVPYDFLFVGGYTGRGDRKGADKIVKAFTEEFKEGESSLYLKINTVYGECPIQDLAIRKDITVDLNQYTDSEMADVYRKAKYYICPSAAEGFDMSCLQALACGMPVISSSTGQSDYLNYLLRFNGHIHRLEGSPQPARFSPWDTGLWYPIDLKGIKHALRLYHKSKPKNLKFKGIEKWTWNASAKIAMRCLNGK